MKETIIINLFGSPCSGKSTCAAYLFSKFKLEGINCELVTEYAKDMVYEGNNTALSDQIYVFGHQHFRISKLIGKVDVIITDAPLENSIFYNSNEDIAESFERLVWDIATQYRTVNVFLERIGTYEQSGRLQTEYESNKMSDELYQLFEDYLDWDTDKYFLATDKGYNTICEIMSDKFPTEL